MNRSRVAAAVGVIVGSFLLAGAGLAHDPAYTSEFDRARCTFSSTGSNPYFPLLPGLVAVLEGEEDGEDIQSVNSVLDETELVDGVVTRVIVEQESEGGELTEISRNFFAECRETGDVWYFGEDVDIYEDGVVVSHDGAWRAGENGASAGIFMPGTPLVGARFFQELAPGVAEDRSEVFGIGGTVVTPAGTFNDVVTMFDTNALSPSSPGDNKEYAPGLGLIVDEILELVSYELPACLPDATTHCLQGGRFRVSVEWEDFQGGAGDGHAILASDQSGEFWFFGPGNTEMLVKVIDACEEPGFNSYWVFAAGLTNVGVRLEVVDTKFPAMAPKVYENPVGTNFAPILDTAAFSTCP